MSDGTAERVAMARPGPMLQYVFSAIVLFLALFGSHLATPLYPFWQDRFDLTNSDIVMIFVCYPIGVTFGLLHGGRLGDQLGRKPMVRSGLFLILLASLGYLVANSMTPLLVARLLNGYGIGMLSGPAVASIIELHPRLDRGAASRVGAVATLSAPAAGMLTATLVVYFAATETAVCCLT
ncbi:MFS transporter [Seohaeicola zhoushanensis]